MSVQPPDCLRKPLDVRSKLLMGPGPSNCHPRVLHALSRPIMGHLHPETTKIMDDIKEGIRYIFQTNNDLTLAVSTSGHGGMEAVLCNLLEPGDKVLIAVNGLWGERAADMASRYGGVVNYIKVDFGRNFSLNELEAAIRNHKPVLLFIVQGDSSTGVYQPLEGLGDICHRYDCLLVVDAVASLGGVAVCADSWGIDAIYTGSQKAISAPPGLAPISFSRRAQDRIFNRKSPVKVFYWDMKLLGDYWACFGRPRIYHHTISCTLLYGLREGLSILVEEGLQNVIERHQNCALRLYEGLKKLDLNLFVEEFTARLPTVTAIKVPEDVSYQDIIAYAMKNYGLEISGGLGPTVGKVFRIGLLGYNATFDNVDFVLRIMQEALNYARSQKSSKL